MSIKSDRREPTDGIKNGDIIECVVSNFSGIQNGKALWSLVVTEGYPYMVFAEKPIGYVLIIGTVVEAKVVDAGRWRVEVIR